MASKRNFTEKVESFCEKAHERQYGMVSSHVDSLCNELRSCTTKIGTSDFGNWSDRLDRVSHAYDACDQAGGMQSMCNPFIDKADRLAEACRML